MEAMSYNVATPDDFLIMSGVCVWPKLGGGLLDEVKRGLFEVVEPSRVEGVLHALRGQRMLTKDSLADNMSITNEAWRIAGAGDEEPTKNEPADTLTVGIGEGFDEEDETVVFNSDVKVSQLANDALKKWVATFLLGSPTFS